uniref:Uncharacterized protein n=1 Tax=Octopus bimaculoides TaxID=37653 RepID=A0A0L8GUE4_OCTBM
MSVISKQLMYSALIDRKFINRTQQGKEENTLMLYHLNCSTMHIVTYSCRSSERESF